MALSSQPIYMLYSFDEILAKSFSLLEHEAFLIKILLKYVGL